MIETRFRCRGCHAKLAVGLQHRGKSVPCPRCGATVRVPQQTLMPGSRLGGYEIDHLLGHGTMGEVYLARQVQMNRMVALKILPNADELLLQFFRREVRTLAKLDHPHIVTAFEAGDEKGIFYLAMAYIQGETLNERIERMGPFPEREALEIVRQVGAALAYAWASQKLLHRDVKPANIMLENGTDTKLMDLGLSCSLAPDSDLQPDAPEAIGTPDYMAPEVIAAQPGQDFRIDLYALGATLYYLLTGKPPYGPAPVDQVLAAHTDAPIPDPRKLEPSISDATAMLVTWMLAKRPSDRPISWGAWEKAIAAVIAGVSASKLQALVPVPVPEPNPDAGSSSGIRRRAAPGVKTLTTRRRNGSSAGSSAGSGTMRLKTDQFKAAEIADAVAARQAGRGEGDAAGTGAAKVEAAVDVPKKPSRPPGPPPPPWFWPAIIGGVVALLMLIVIGILAAWVI